MSKVIITGTGRAGTSFLVRLLTLLGEDTGFTKDDDIIPQLRAGLEHKLDWHSAKSLRQGPRIIKKPLLSLSLKEVMEQGLNVEAVIIPVRDIDEVVESRKTSGTNWMGNKTKKKSMEMLYQAIYACTSTDTPVILMDFDKMVTDGVYCHKKLNQVFDFDLKEFTKKYIAV